MTELKRLDNATTFPPIAAGAVAGNDLLLLLDVSASTLGAPSYRSITVAALLAGVSGGLQPLREITTNLYTIQMAATDYEVGIDNPVSAASDVTLPLAPTSGQWAIVSDLKGDAGTYAITVHGPMNGGTSMTINANFGFAVFRYSAAAGQWLNRGIVG